MTDRFDTTNIPLDGFTAALLRLETLADARGWDRPASLWHLKRGVEVPVFAKQVAAPVGGGDPAGHLLGFARALHDHMGDIRMVVSPSHVGFAFLVEAWRLTGKTATPGGLAAWDQAHAAALDRTVHVHAWDGARRNCRSREQGGHHSATDPDGAWPHTRARNDPAVFTHLAEPLPPWNITRSTGGCGSPTMTALGFWVGRVCYHRPPPVPVKPCTFFQPGGCYPRCTVVRPGCEHAPKFE